MKKLYSLLFLFFVAIGHAQVVTIPNANFKAKLLASTSTNYIARNSIGVSIKIDTNNDGQIQVSEALLVAQLNVSNAAISDLTGIESFTNLTSLYCPNNQLTSLGISSLVKLTYLNCSYNAISNLNLNSLILLQSVYCNNNQLTIVNVSALVKLTYLDCSYNSLSSLNLNYLTLLQTVYCNNNLLTSMSYAGLSNLYYMYCQHNQLTSFDFTGMTKLYNVDCSYNNLSTVDLSVNDNTFHGYDTFDFSYNPNLISINAKDNAFSLENFIDVSHMPPSPWGLANNIIFAGTPKLQYICADSEEVYYLQSKVNQLGYTNSSCQISSTCSFLPITSHVTTITNCGSYTWPLNNQTYTASGTYSVANANAIEVLSLTIIQSTTHNTTVVAGDSFLWTFNNQNYTSSGNYSVVNDCHTETLNLTITPSVSNTTTISACGSYTWPQNNQTYTASGTYTDSVSSPAQTLNLTITPVTSNTTTISACGSYTWSVNNQIYTTSGNYSYNNGCQTENLELTISSNVNTTSIISSCGSYTWSVNNQTYDFSGIYTVVNGCQTQTLALTVNSSIATSATVSSCGSYTWNIFNTSVVLTTSGFYAFTNGCRTEYLNLTIIPSTSHTTTAASCGSYTWSLNNQTYTSSGIYSIVNGCNTEYLNLTITPITNHTTTIVACDNYTWSVNNQTYTTSGVYSKVTGCNTEYLNLTITPSTSHTTTIASCDNYTWSLNNQTYTTSGIYSFVNGCNAEYLNLTITPSTSHTTTITSCDNYTWSLNNQMYTTSGVYSVVSGCNTEYLNLTIIPSTSHDTSITACGIYTWSENNQTYTASGTYSVVNGCNTEYLNLTINNSLITTQPLGPILCTTTGSTATITVSSNVALPIYTWQYRVVTATLSNPSWITINSTNAGAIYTDYTSATLGIKRTTSSLPKIGTQYRVIVEGGPCGAVTSNEVNLTILGTVKAGSIASLASICLGNNITFGLNSYVGTSIQWQSALNATSSFVDIPGATMSTYTATNMQLDSNKSYRAVITNSACGTSATTSIKTIKVDPYSVAGTITGGGDVCQGSSSTLKISGYVGKIEWEYSTDGLNYLSAPKAADNQTLPFGTTSASNTSTSYLINAISSNLYFRAKITSGNCYSVYTTPVQYTIRTQAVVGTISPAATTLCPANGTTLSLSDAIGVITWQKSTNYTLATPTWSATTNHTLTLSTGNLTVSTAYRAMVTIGGCSTVYSDIAYVYIVPKPISKSITANVTTPSGTTTNLALCNTASKVLTIGSGFVGSIQWQTSTVSTTSGFVDIAGATDASYTVTNPSIGVNYYRAKFTNICGLSVYNNAVILYYKNCILPKNEFKSLFDVVATPNPYYEKFNLAITTSSEEIIRISIYDMKGSLIDDRKTYPNEISELKIGERYPSGIYNVVITQGEEIKTLRIIKK